MHFSVLAIFRREKKFKNTALVLQKACTNAPPHYIKRTTMSFQVFFRCENNCSILLFNWAHKHTRTHFSMSLAIFYLDIFFVLVLHSIAAPSVLCFALDLRSVHNLKCILWCKRRKRVEIRFICTHIYSCQLRLPPAHVSQSAVFGASRWWR